VRSRRDARAQVRLFARDIPSTETCDIKRDETIVAFSFRIERDDFERERERSATLQTMMRSLIALSPIGGGFHAKKGRPRTSMSFSLFSSLTLNREYPAGVSNKSSMFLLLLLLLLLLLAACGLGGLRFDTLLRALCFGGFGIGSPNFLLLKPFLNPNFGTRP
jgi:hypothetical protein